MKKKMKFGFVEPTVIMAVVTSLIILGVGTFAFFVTQGALSETSQFNPSGTQCTTVTNPAIAQTVTIPADATITRVYETLNTGSTQNIDAGNYTFAGTTVTINVTG